MLKNIQQTNLITLSFSFIIDSIEDGLLNLTPSYSRPYSWGSSEQSNLLTSIFNGTPIGNITISETFKDNNKIEIIDGKHRLLTIYKFYKNQIPYINEDNQKLFYKELDKDTQLAFLKELYIYAFEYKNNVSQIQKYKHFYLANFASFHVPTSHQNFIMREIYKLEQEENEKNAL